MSGDFRFFYPPSCPRLFHPAQYDSINAAVTPLFGVPLSALNQLKPAAVTTQITGVLAMREAKNFNLNEGIDDNFQKEGTKSGKKVGGLETAESQFKVLFESQTLQRQAELLYCTVTHMDRTIHLGRPQTHPSLLQAGPRGHAPTHRGENEQLLRQYP